MHNKMITPLAFVVPVGRDEEGRPGFSADGLRLPLLLTKDPEDAFDKSNLTMDQLSESLEIYFRRMISNCALSINIPYEPEAGWLNHSDIKQLLSPSMKNAVNFIDKNNASWNACSAYLEPIKNSSKNEAVVDQLQWCIYLLVLSSNHKAEVAMPPAQVLNIIEQLKNHSSLDAESKTRLAKLEGIFNLFNTVIEVPNFSFEKVVSEVSITDRISEILEDAYLLEASQLRRFFSLNSNKASISRDLRKLLSFISNKRDWAKGLLGVGSSTLYGGDSSVKALEKLVDIIPSLTLQNEQPVLTSYDQYFSKGPESFIELVRCSTGNAFRFEPSSYDET